MGDASRLAALVARLRPDESGHYKRALGSRHAKRYKQRIGVQPESNLLLRKNINVS
jgi:hypothetical protein